MLKLCYLFTFITALLKLLGVINLGWLAILAPSIFASGITIMLAIFIVIGAALSD